MHQRYQREARVREAVKDALQYLAIGLTLLGSVLGALGKRDWIIITTTIASALTSGISYFKLETVLKAKQQATHVRCRPILFATEPLCFRRVWFHFVPFGLTCEKTLAINRMSSSSSRTGSRARKWLMTRLMSLRECKNSLQPPSMRSKLSRRPGWSLFATTRKAIQQRREGRTSLLVVHDCPSK